MKALSRTLEVGFFNYPGWLCSPAVSTCIGSCGLQIYTSRLKHISHALSTASTGSDSTLTSSDHVRAELQLAGVPDSTIGKVFSACPGYWKWDLEGKLKPVLKSWSQELGPQRLATQLHRFPFLLRRTPAETQEMQRWLSSQGVVDAEQAIYTCPSLMKINVSTLQRKMDKFSSYNTPSIMSLLLRHPDALTYEPQRVYDICNAMAQVLELDVASEAMAEFTSSIRNQRVFSAPATDLVSRMSEFSQHFRSDQATKKRALRRGVYLVETSLLLQRAEALKHKLELTDLQLKKLLREPQMLLLKTETLQEHVDPFLMLGFSTCQLRTMVVAQPALLTINMATANMTEKWRFITQVMKLSVVKAASSSGMLTQSLQTTLGPRHGYLLQLLISGALSEQEHQGLQATIYSKTGDAGFVARVGKVIEGSDLQFDSVFKERWQRNWKRLTQQQGIPVQDVGARQRELLGSFN